MKSPSLLNMAMNRKGDKSEEYLHLPLAAGCNIRCSYCVPGHACVSSGTAGRDPATLLDAEEALHRVEDLLQEGKRKPRILLAGPGEPLASPKTYEFLEAANREYRKLDIALATNGLVLPDRFKDLLALNVSTLWITINASTPDTAELIHPWVLYRRNVHHGTRGALLLLNNQWSGLIAAVETGFVVRVNFVALPGINGHEAGAVAQTAGRLGADCMRVVAPPPRAKTPCSIEAVSLTDAGRIRDECDRFLPQV